jgi:hypothetical protein
MDQRLSLITLGVAEVGRAQKFYEALGWSMDGGVDNDSDHVAFFQAGGSIVALWDRAKLAADSCVEDGAAGAGRRSRRAGTRRSSSIPTAFHGKSPTTPTGPFTTTGRRP